MFSTAMKHDVSVETSLRLHQSIDLSMWPNRWSILDKEEGVCRTELSVCQTNGVDTSVFHPPLLNAQTSL